jgi:pyruvate dehydrogenase E2 component (dihydrolipoamide acetyltransferase)
MTAFTVERGLSPWRKIALSTWATGGEASIYGWIDVDATRLGAYIEAARSQTGVRLTVTHLVGKAAAMALAESPSANAVVSLGRLKRRESVDVFFSVVTDGGKGLAGQKLREVDRLSVVDVARKLSRDVGRIRDTGDSDLQRSQKLLFRLPSGALGTVMKAVGAATFDLGVDLERHGIPADPFGSVVVTNVGVFGIEQGLGPLIPHGRTAALLTVGKIRDRVLAVNGKPEVRPVLTLGGTFDHRVVDGHTLGLISARLREILEDPARALDADAGDYLQAEMRN